MKINQREELLKIIIELLDKYEGALIEISSNSLDPTELSRNMEEIEGYREKIKKVRN